MVGMFTRVRILLALAVVGAVAAAAGSALAAEQGTDSQITISPRTVVASAGQTSPVDVGGIRAVRAGKPIPSGYVLVGRHVKFTRGTEVGYGALTMDAVASEAGVTVTFIGSSPSNTTSTC